MENKVTHSAQTYPISTTSSPSSAIADPAVGLSLPPRRWLMLRELLMLRRARRLLCECISSPNSDSVSERFVPEYELVSHESWFAVEALLCDSEYEVKDSTEAADTELSEARREDDDVGSSSGQEPGHARHDRKN